MAEENTNVVETTETNAGAETTETAQTTKMYTAKEVDALLQAEADKRVTQALKKQQAKYEKEISLAKLDGNEREKAERENRIAELEQQLAEFQIERNKSELKSVLSSRGLSAEFADIIAISDDIAESQAKIDALDKLFKNAVKTEVERRLGETGGTPKGNAGYSSENISKEAFRKMSLAEQSQLAKENKELYTKLTT